MKEIVFEYENVNVSSKYSDRNNKSAILYGNDFPFRVRFVLRASNEVKRKKENTRWKFSSFDESF